MVGVVVSGNGAKSGGFDGVVCMLDVKLEESDSFGVWEFGRVVGWWGFGGASWHKWEIPLLTQRSQGRDESNFQ